MIHRDHQPTGGGLEEQADLIVPSTFLALHGSLNVLMGIMEGANRD